MILNSPVVLITGASSGIGQACARQLHATGCTVFGTSRRPVAGTPFPMLQLDVDDDASVQAGVAHVLAQTGRLDVVINNAGFALAGSIEDTSIDEMKAQFETNFFGVMRVSRAALPIMRAQRSGLILTLSSGGGIIGLPFQGIYSASKFALEGAMEALSHEVRPFGIKVILLRPGDYKTNSIAYRRRAAQAQTATPYQRQFEITLAAAEHDEQSAPTPEPVARVVERIVRSRSPRLRYSVGPFIERLAMAAKPVLPDAVFAVFVRKFYRLEE